MDRWPHDPVVRDAAVEPLERTGLGDIDSERVEKRIEPFRH
jgi:hypothetical protein